MKPKTNHEYINIKKLKPHPKNPKIHSTEQIQGIADSIRELGWGRPIILSQDNYILAGHGAVLAAELLDYDEVPYRRMKHEHDTPEALAYLLVDNKSSELATWDNELLHDDLIELDTSNLNTSLTMFSDDEIKELQNEIQHLEDTNTEVVEDDYDIDNEVEPIVQLGDIWQLGNHKLMCGDSIEKTNLNKLIGTNKINMLLTDPPYGVDYNSKNEMLNKFDKGNCVQKEIVNDNINDYKAFFTEMYTIIKPFFNDYNTLYTFMSGQELHNLRIGLENANGKWGDYLIWVKNNHVLGRKDYNSKHEFCMYGWFNKHKFHGDFTTTILEFNKPTKSKLHPTMKPIELLAKLITDGSTQHSNILDLFGGSGSTLIACEQLNRNCYMMELDPHYCDVIIKRWEEFTNQKATKIPNPEDKEYVGGGGL
jgi:DNA modification methylase